MSVIIGIKSPFGIIVAADRRSTAPDGSFDDTHSKIYVVNKDLIFSSMGYAVYGALVVDAMNNTKNKEHMTINEFHIKIMALYDMIKFGHFNYLNLTVDSFRFVLAGKNNNGEMELIFCYNANGKMQTLSNESNIYPPDGMSHSECLEILSNNCRKYPTDFPQRTIKEISSINNMVSPSCDKYTYISEKDEWYIEFFQNI